MRQKKYRFLCRDNEYSTTLKPYRLRTGEPRDDKKRTYNIEKIQFDKEGIYFEDLCKIVKNLKNYLKRGKIQQLRNIVRTDRILSNQALKKHILSTNCTKDIQNCISRITDDRSSIWLKKDSVFYNNFIDIAELSEVYWGEKNG